MTKNTNYLTNVLITQMQTAGSNWLKGWDTGLPYNKVTGAVFSGYNRLLCMVVHAEENYSSNEYFTYLEATKLGSIKGQKATQLLRPVIKKAKDENGDEVVTGKYFKPHNYFNADQIEGYSPQIKPVLKLVRETHADAEAFLLNCGLDIRYGGDRAFYSLSEHYIQSPNIADYKSSADYFCTMFHEHIHSTIEAMKRNTDRKCIKAVSYEELVAEIGACFLANHFGIETTPRAEHAQYLNSWIKALGNDTKYIQAAAADAQKAMDYLIKTSTTNASAKLGQPIAA